jgi:hypothetical protein
MTNTKGVKCKMNSMLLLAILVVSVFISMQNVHGSMANTTLTPLQAYNAKMLCVKDDTVKVEDMEKCYDKWEKIFTKLQQAVDKVHNRSEIK